MKNKKSAAVGLVICFVAVIALVGAVTFSRYKGKSGNQLAKVEGTTDTKDNRQEIREAQDTQTTNSRNIENEVKDTKEEEKPQATENIAPPAAPTSNQSDALAFSESDLLAWPVDGNVMMNYSMDQTVYFATLDQYKYNPALVISGEVGNEVKASARGIVKSIEVTAQTGTTITMDLGNGYEAIYGQLKEVPVQEGTYVEKGGLIGYLSEPTKYYSVEGCNLYFQMRKDGEPINPMEYMDVE